MERRTWDGSDEPDAHAEPEETATPCISRAVSRDSASTNSKLRLSVLGSLKIG